MITAETVTVIQTQKISINHCVLHPLLIVILALELFFSDSQALRCQYLVLYAIIVRITLFMVCTPPPLPGSSTEHVFSLQQIAKVLQQAS